MTIRVVDADWFHNDTAGVDKLDGGNYKPGEGFLHAAAIACAGEFGESSLRKDFLERLDTEINLVSPIPWGLTTLHHKGLSIIAAAIAFRGRILQRGDWPHLINYEVDEKVMAAPKLTTMPFPDVMVARCHPNSMGDGIEFSKPQVSAIIGFADLKEATACKLMLIKNGKEEDVVSGIKADGEGRVETRVMVSERSEFILMIAQ